jgi:hypothetical protein
MASFVNLADDHDVQVALIQETNIHPTSHLNMANHLQVPDDWALAIPSSAVTDTNTGKGISIMVNSSLGPPAPLLNPKPLLTMSYEVIQPTFELLAGQVAGVTFVTIYMHNSTTTSAGRDSSRFLHQI